MKWDARIPAALRGSIIHNPVCHIIDILPTCLESAGVEFPRQFKGVATIPPEGISLVRVITSGKEFQRAQPLFWEHEGNRAIRDGKWKCVASYNQPWELYDIESDRAELNNLAEERPEILQQLIKKYDEWTNRVGVKPWQLVAQPASTAKNIKQNKTIEQNKQ